MAKIPLVDIYEKIIFNCLILLCKHHDYLLIPKPYWPGKKNFAVCLTHDVDRLIKTHQYITHPIKSLLKGDFFNFFNLIRSIQQKIKGVEPYWNFEKILNIENKLGVKSSFYFLNEEQSLKSFGLNSYLLYCGRYNISDPKVIEIMKSIKERGWEVCVHGSFRSYQNKSRLKDEKHKLESLIGISICGIRQHHLNLKIPLTWVLQEGAGFVHDSTLGFKKDIGFRSGTCFPFYPLNTISGRQLDLLEIPLIIMDSALFLKQNALEKCREILNIVEKNEGILTILWHTEIFNDIDYPEWIKMYEWLIKESKRKNAWVTNANEIQKWWSSR